MRGRGGEVERGVGREGEREGDEERRKEEVEKKNYKGERRK